MNVVRARWAGWLLLSVAALGCGGEEEEERGPQQSLRFLHGDGGQVNGGMFGVFVPLVDRAINVGEGDFTIEAWVRSEDRLDAWGGCRGGANQGVSWLDGHVVIDRSDTGAPSFFGLSLFGDAVAFGVGDMNYHEGGACEQAYLDDGQWHHIAGVREGGNVRAYVDGTAHVTVGGLELDDASYHGMSDDALADFLIIGGRKTDGVEPWRGWIDEVRISSMARYPAQPAPEGPFQPDAATAALYHFDVANDDTVTDASSNRSDGGIVNDVGGEWTIEYDLSTPFVPAEDDE